MGSPYDRASSARRPLSRALAPLRRRASTSTRHGAELLGDLIDFKGAVEVSRTLGARLARPDAVSGPEALAAARRILERAEREARKPLVERDTRTRADSRDDATPLATRVEALLHKATSRAPRRPALTAAAREIFTPIETRARERITTLRRLAQAAREEIGPAIAAQGGTSARLEQIEGALAAATTARIDDLFARAVRALADAFVTELESAVLATPPVIPEPAAAWAERFVAEHVGRCEALVLAVFQHERTRIELLGSTAFVDEAG